MAKTPARSPPVRPAREFLDNLYPAHTGEAGGGVGRLLSLAVAAWLLTMLLLGLGRWWTRRSRRT